jgi:YVTN family beta-propeller protein
MKHRSDVVAATAVLALSIAFAPGGCSDDESASGSSSSTSTTSSSTGGGGPPDAPPSSTVSSTLALTQDDKSLWVVNQDSDSISLIDTGSRTLVEEVPLGDGPPAEDPVTKRFEPKITPRALALWHDGEKIYVAGQTANAVYVVNGETRAVDKVIPVPAEPTGVACARDGTACFVASSQAGTISKIDPTTDAVVAEVSVPELPWNVTVSDDGKWLYVPHLLLDPGVSVIDAAAMTVRNKVPLADQPVPEPFDKRLPNGPARGLYGVVPRPGTGELWIPHLLLAVGTAQDPANEELNLDFESTVFPTISTIDAAGQSETRRLLFRPTGAIGVQGAFTDSVSGPRAIAFTPDGSLALVALGQSEDVLVFDAESGTSKKLVRPLPSGMLEGIVVSHDGTAAYVEGRNTHDVTVLKIDPTNDAAPVEVDGAAIERITADPMPAHLRLGQRLFWTANSAQFPITKNFWVACVSCHIEGGSDAVTWVFGQGPRDTPANFGGMLGQGFLFRTAARNQVQQYDETIRVEQGGNYHLTDPAQKGDLDALADYVNYAIPFPQNPYRAADGQLTEAQARGKAVFDEACATCHYGEFYTDSGKDNPTLDLAGTITLHDVGTCDTKGDVRDRAHKDYEGHDRGPCDFDTPTLRGVFATAPYFHDGSARTLKDVVDRLPYSADLSEEDKADLVAYVQTL